MSDVCRACRAVVDTASEDWRLLPAADDGTFIDGLFCEACWPAALQAARDEIAGADAEDHDDLLQAGLIRAYFRARGVDLGPEEPAGREAVVASALRMLDQVEARGGFWWRKVMCSRCFETRRELDVTTVPSWNEDACRHVTTYRCSACLPDSIDETRRRLAGCDDTELASLCALLERHAVIVHEHRRGDPPDVVRSILQHVLTMIADGCLVLPIGKTRQLG